ncbi:hypothetical protein BV898_19358 [Hypsibius exemplaris]|uniref:Uncharacterized protein n=1 Tax=Hypsibius exemplaris TaxID=2072580 RepID=A0A9X6NQK3_HYPEX|nr:hypothetical protein BV898_19358 [Hypsibius exemplaris]
MTVEEVNRRCAGIFNFSITFVYNQEDDSPAPLLRTDSANIFWQLYYQLEKTFTAVLGFTVEYRVISSIQIESPQAAASARHMTNGEYVYICMGHLPLQTERFGNQTDLFRSLPDEVLY